MDKIHEMINNTVQYQSAGTQLLAQTIATALNESRWISNDLKIRFCILFMLKILESQLVKSDKIIFIQKIKKRPLRFTIRLLKRYPERGLHILSQAIMDELQSNQNFKLEQLVDFHSALLDLLFPSKIS